MRAGAAVRAGFWLFALSMSLAPRVDAQGTSVPPGPYREILLPHSLDFPMEPNNGLSTTITTGNAMDYHGGAVLLGTTHVYYIWYGNWDSGSKSTLTNLASHIGGSPYFNINTGYFDGNGASVSNSVSFSGSATDANSRGNSLNNNDIWSIVKRALALGVGNGGLPTDSNGVYFVLTASSVQVAGFPTSVCGWHTQQSYNGTNIQLAFVGNPGTLGQSCIPDQNPSVSPNGNAGVDAMASVIAHELEEAVTDPGLDAWYDSSGQENADKCAWTFGTTYTTPNGAKANMKLGGKDYLIQRNWVNAAGGFCALSASPGPDFALTAETASRTTSPGGVTGSYAITIIPVKGFSAAINFSVGGLPAGVTANFTDPSATGASFTISTPITVAGGTYPFTITAASGSITHKVSATLVVNGPALSPVVTHSGSLAHLVSGDGWQTTFSLVNLGSTPSLLGLTFYGDSGGALTLPLIFPQSSQAPSNNSTVNQTLNANSLLLLNTSGGQTLSSGWADLSSTGSVNAYEVFRYSPSGQEAVVPLQTSNASSYLLMFDNTSLVNTLGTGIAIANLSTQAANVAMTIRDDAGVQMTTGSISVPSLGHTAFTLADQFAATSGKRGTVEFFTPLGGQISVLAIRANGDAFTTIPVIANGSAGGGTMAHIVSGGGWRSVFSVANPGATPADVTLSFFDDAGSPLVLPLTSLQTGGTSTASKVTKNLAPGASLVIQAQGLDAQVAMGSAQLTTTGSAGGFVVFRYDPSGQEATAPFENRNKGAYVLAFDNTAPLATGVALANLSSQSTSVGMILRDDAGTTLQSATIPLAGNAHLAFVLGGNYPLAAGKRGTVEFTSSGAPISVLGIRANGNAFTSIPVLTR